MPGPAAGVTREGVGPLRIDMTYDKRYSCSHPGFRLGAVASRAAMQRCGRGSAQAAWFVRPKRASWFDGRASAGWPAASLTSGTRGHGG